MAPQDDAQLAKELQGFDYPKRAALTEEADMVMKGGITSGVVYPLAVCEMAKTKRFRNLGGTSAGGIAAAIAAAAELGRDGGGFQRLARLPEELGRDLQHMFQPCAGTAPLFSVLLASLEKKRLHMVGVAVRAAWRWFVVALGAVELVVALGLVAAGASASLRLLAGLAVGLVLAVPLAAAAAGVGLGLSAKKRLDDNGYGLCIGSSGSRWQPTAPAAVEPFCDWLHARLNEAAGRPRSHVLTFAELWGAPPGTAVRPDDYDLRLEMMTTNVTFCRPVRLPFEQHLYSFCPRELAGYFPQPVFEHLLQHARQPSKADAPVLHCPDHPDQALVRLPVAGDLPVVVAVRLTLSFPLLISAVPLFASDWGAAEGAPVRCWFSDGGISSNFPIHFFDALWPRRPTFGISLGPYPPGRGDEHVYFRGAGKAAVPRVRNTDSILQFLAALADTLQNWSDEGQSMLPGYRDRIVEVRHTDDEGGMNLNMDAEKVLRMSARGHAAAVALSAFDFDRHRDVRYRTAMAQLDRAGRDMLAKYDNKLPGGLDGYRAFLQRSPFSRATGPWRDAAVSRTDLLLTFVGRPDGEVPKPDFLDDDTEPHPIPDMRIVAHF